MKEPMEVIDMESTVEQTTIYNRNRILIISALAGILGSLSISGLFFITMFVFASVNDALNLLWSLKLWIVPLIFGFGLQVVLFAYMKSVLKFQKAALSVKASVTASGGVSAVSMAACCVHHFTDILPFLGVTALATFFTEYQIFFLAVGISSNIMGIFFMLKNIIGHGLYLEDGFISKLKSLNIKLLFRYSIAVSIMFALSVLIKITFYN